MTLDLLVPHWQETPDEMEPLLGSVAVQQGIDLGDVGVIIAYDGPDASELPLDEWRRRYPFRISDVHPDRGGVSHARNAALDASAADYVMFCDADDMLCDACGLFVVFREMATGFDTLVSVFREQAKDAEGNLTFVNHDNDSTFVHGKVHRRQWLVDNGIRFDDSLTVHEDSYFNILCREIADPDRAKYCPLPFYLWRWRDASVCRHDKKYILKTYNEMLDSNDALIGEFIRRGMTEKAVAYCVMMTWDAYYLMNKAEWREQENQEYRRAVERRFSRYYRKHRELWDSMPEQQRMAVSSVVRQRSVLEGMLAEDLTIGQWLRRISACCKKRKKRRNPRRG